MALLALQADRTCPKSIERKWIAYSLSTLTRYARTVSFIPWINTFLNHGSHIVDATDSKGEPIHQTLMAKKMQRLDESPDFRPFKFRIQAFTLAFLEEVSWHQILLEVTPFLSFFSSPDKDIRKIKSR
jgi:hypothetical protein